ncbi:MAG: hypothetical protein Q9190_007967, partial [Brigantiaea leucoxantha]
MPPLMRSISLSPLNPSAPPAPALVTEFNAYAPSSATEARDKYFPSPKSAKSIRFSEMVEPRSASKQTARIAELLATMKEGEDGEKAVNGDGIRKVEQDEAAEARAACAALRSTSRIEFFDPHPSESQSLTTFLGSNSWHAATTSTASSSCASAVSSQPRVQKRPVLKLLPVQPSSITLPKPTARGMTPLSSSPSQQSTTPHDPLANFERLNLQSQPSPPSQPHGRDGLENIQVGRPIILTELPGRFRSSQSCWRCCENKAGERCKACAAVVEEPRTKSKYQWEEE